MGSKPLLTVLWLVGTVVAATVAWQSLSFVSASTESDLAVPARSENQTGRATATQPTTPSSTTTRPEATTTTGTTGRATTTTTISGATGTTPEAEAIEQTFELIGGRAAVSFSPTEILVVWATPEPGYTVESHPEDGGIEVEFNNGVHESKLEAWWADGPRFETRERDD